MMRLIRPGQIVQLRSDPDATDPLSLFALAASIVASSDQTGGNCSGQHLALGLLALAPQLQRPNDDRVDHAMTLTFVSTSHRRFGSTPGSFGIGTLARMNCALKNENELINI